MANFREAYAVTKDFEGVYSDDLDDRGGQTLFGIARNRNPHWKGWPIVDRLIRENSHLSQAQIASILKTNEELLRLCRAFYKAEYWDRFSGDRIRSQEVASFLFDCGVNSGVRRAVRFLQEAMNLLNRKSRSWKNIKVDGLWGRNTAGTLERCLEYDESVLVKVMNILRGAFYLEIMRKDESQERFARGWLKRVRILTNRKVV